MINFAAMNKFALLLIAAVTLLSCADKGTVSERFTIDTINKITPVKDQGHGPLCWIYAMLATIESDRLAVGDSVNLSAPYLGRMMLERETERRYLTGGSAAVRADGMAPMAIALMSEYGVTAYDAYRSDCNFSTLCRKLTAVADNAVNSRIGLDRLRGNTADMLDNEAGPVPRRVWMYGMEYTPQQFARSVCDPDDYQSLTSYTHYPFGEDIPLDLPANRYGCRFTNVPIDSLVRMVDNTLRSGLSVCWEGDVSNAGFSFERGVADTEKPDVRVTQADRQRALERFEVTDDHCMALIGLAHDSRGRRYYVCKNSWGTDNPYDGLMFMSLEYFRLNTVAVVMKPRDR